MPASISIAGLLTSLVWVIAGFPEVAVVLASLALLWEIFTNFME